MADTTTPQEGALSHYPHLAARLFNTPLLMDPDKARVIADVLERAAHGEGLAPAQRTEVPGNAPSAGGQRPYAVSEGGTAIIPIHGSLVQRSGYLDALSGLTSYQQIGAQLDAAAKDSAVRSILLDIDSPGGEAAGLFDLAERIHGARATKPLFAYVDEQAFSAAYAISSAA